LGYKTKDNKLNTYEPVAIDSPYRIETLKDKAMEYKVLYYFTEVKKADNRVSEDELTPFIFEDNKLIGKSDNFLTKLKNKIDK